MAAFDVCLQVLQRIVKQVERQVLRTPNERVPSEGRRRRRAPLPSHPATESVAAARQQKMLEAAIEKGARRAALANASSERSQRMLAMQQQGAQASMAAADAGGGASGFQGLSAGVPPERSIPPPRIARKAAR